MAGTVLKAARKTSDGNDFGGDSIRPRCQPGIQESHTAVLYGFLGPVR